LSTIVQEALTLPNGARFYRCALQVNTFEYLVRHGKKPSFADEAAYNTALVAALVAAGIEVIAVTDHYRIRSAEKLIASARAAGIVVFPGFEAASAEGIHILCLFDPDTPLDRIQGMIASCGVLDDKVASPLGKLSAAQLLDKCTEWNMQCVAAHATSANGVLTALQGQAKAVVWRHPCLVACSIPGPVADTPMQFRSILENKNPDYKRERPIAIINSADVSHPADAAEAGASCWIKMTKPALEGLRQAFLDAESRVRLASDPEPEEHVEFLAIAWETAGFLRGLKLHLNENLVVLVGGRGSGKSTVIESVRYVLDLPPIGAEAAKVHQSIVSNVLKSGTKISLVVRSYRPNRRTFIIERTVGNPPIVRDADTTDVLPLKPLEVVPRVAVFGQNEISELARSPEKLTALLDRFTAIDGEADGKYRAARKNLDQSRRDILECDRKLAEIDEQLAGLPGLEETLGRYRDAGIEAKLKDQALIVREEGIVSTIDQSLAPFRALLSELEDLLPINQDGLSDDNLKELPSKDQLAKLRATVTTFEVEAQRAAATLKDAIAAAATGIDAVSAHIEGRKREMQADYEETLRELQKEKIDGAEFMRLRKAIEGLKPLREQKTKVEERLAGLRQTRRNQLAAWEDLKRERFERLQKAAKKVGKQLAGRLRVKVTYADDRQPLLDLIRDELHGGRLAETNAALQAKPDLSVAALAEACSGGGAAKLTAEFGIPTAQAQRIVEARPALPMLIEELDLAPTTDIELNVSPEGQEPEWRPLKELSTGQKATAMLYLLLIEAEAPLVVDQLEDNLDNRFISEGIVPKIKGEKRRRQFIFATHNANIPVLGDAELILGLSAVGEAGDGHVEVAPQHMGSIDTPEVAALVEEILEGGRDAFTVRRLKYGF
jgi:ABC-type lipoprotein export system ATPase subunit